MPNSVWSLCHPVLSVVESLKTEAEWIQKIEDTNVKDRKKSN